MKALNYSLFILIIGFGACAPPTNDSEKDLTVTEIQLEEPEMDMIKPLEWIAIYGTYSGENMFVQNPNSPTGVGFCVNEVKVNESHYHGEIASSSFEIDFASMGYAPGDSVFVELGHKPNCMLKVLNPEVLDAPVDSVSL